VPQGQQAIGSTAEAGSAQAEHGKGSPGSGEGAEQAAKGSAAGPDATRATSDTGGGSRRYGWRREANRQTVGGDQVFGGKIGGDQVYGGKNYYFGGTRPLARPSLLPSDLTDGVRSAFVGPDGWDDVHARAIGRAVTILTGRRGWGKQGAAIRLMLATPDRQLFQIDRGLEFAELADQIQQGLEARSPQASCVGFLLEEPQQFAGLTGSVLQGVEEELSRAGAQLILTIGSDLSGLDQDLSRFVTDLPGPPDFKRLVADRLAHELGQDHADKLLAEAANRQLIAELLEDEASCARSVALAQELAAEYRRFLEGGEFRRQRIRPRVLGHGASLIETWFARLPDTKSRALAISLAVLPGLSFECVATSSLKLLAKLDLTTPSQLIMSSGDDIAPEGSRPFRMTRREWLRKLNAVVDLAEIRGPYGVSRSEIVAYEEHDFATKVLKHAWSGFDVQEILLHWLKQLAEDDSEQVRIHAGLALGQLACWSFEYICDSVLVPWAYSDKEERREAVAYALSRVASTEPLLRKQARLLAVGWYANREEPYAQATAARVHGLALGQAEPVAAIEALTRLLVVDDIWVAIAVGEGITDLLAPELESANPGSEGNSSGLITTALMALNVAMADRERTEMAQLASLMVTAGLLTDGPGQDAANVEWPALLWLTQRRAQTREPIVALWRHMLDIALFHEQAHGVITAWALYAEADLDVREAFLRLARAIVRGHPRCRAILSRYAELWSSSQNLQPLPIVSAALQAILAAESEAAWPASLS
jgi:hypothetical protein